MNLDLMPLLRISVIARINEHFNRRAVELSHIDHAHARKRQIAVALMAGERISNDHQFAVEAVDRKMNLSDFAQMIANKPDDISHRELLRQRTIAQIESAETPADLDAITNKIG